MNNSALAKYIRLSSEDNDVDGIDKDESVSVTAQRQLISNYICDHSELHNIPQKEFVDDGFTGTNFDRPAFQNMMEEARRGSISIIIVKDLSRFGRDHLGVGNYLERILPILQIRLIAINDGYDSSKLDGMTGGMSVALHNILNAMYCRDLSVKLRSALKSRAERGEYLAPSAPFGYIKDPSDKHHLIIDENAAEIVRLLFELVASGLTKGKIVRYLNDNEFMTPLEYNQIHSNRKLATNYSDKRMWTAGSVNSIIRNEIYIGKTVWNKSGRIVTGHKKQVGKDRAEWIIIEGKHDAIVSESLFKKANAVLVENRRSRDMVRQPVTKKALFVCPHCDHGLRPNRKTYVCREANYSGIDECKTVRVDRQLLEQTMVDLVNIMVALIDEKKLNKERNRSGITDISMEISEKKAKDLKEAQERLRAKKLELYADLREGKISKEQYFASYERIAESMVQIDRDLSELNHQEQTNEVHQNFVSIEEKQLREVAAIKEYDKVKLLTVIDKVKVYDNNHIEVDWKCKDYNELFKDRNVGTKD